MKVIEKNLLDFEKQTFMKPIRTKADYIKVLLEASRLILIGHNYPESDAKIKIVVDKMSRLFFFTKEKYYSIAYPFTVIIEDEEPPGYYSLFTPEGKEVNNKSISDVISLLNESTFSLSQSIFTLMTDNDCYEEDGIILLTELLQVEPSYVRYDYDPDNENGKIHPINHLDFNYTSNSCIKLGLHDPVSIDQFEDLQNLKTDCSFLERY